MKKIKVMSVFGTRPEAIKMAPLVQTLAQRPEFESICCLTGQHREMLDSVMQIFRLTAQYDLNIMQKQQTLSSITTRALLGMEQALQEAQPDLVLVHGDTSTTFAGALAAFYHQVKVGHVEAGLAEIVRTMPLDRIVLETDCPYLTPAPHRGERNESAYVRYVCEKVAELKGLTPGETAEATTVNAERIFGK